MLLGKLTEIIKISFKYLFKLSIFVGQLLYRIMLQCKSIDLFTYLKIIN